MTGCAALVSDYAWLADAPASELRDAYLDMAAQCSKASALLDRAVIRAGGQRAVPEVRGARVAPLGGWFLVLVGVALAAWAVKVIVDAVSAKHRFETLVEAAERSGQLPELMRRELGAGKGTFEEAAGSALTTLAIGAVLIGGAYLFITTRRRRDTATA